MTLILNNTSAPPSGDAARIPPQKNDEPVVKNTFFFPDIDPQRIRERMRLERSVTPELLREAIKTGIAETNAELYDYRAAQLAAGFLRLIDVPSDDIGGGNLRVFYYERAVCALATGSLYQRYRSSRICCFSRQRASIDSAIDTLWRDMRKSVSRIQENPQAIGS